VTTSLANLDASLVALRNVKTYHAIDANTVLDTQVFVKALGRKGDVEIDIYINYYMQSWLPFKMNQLNVQTVRFRRHNVQTVCMRRGAGSLHIKYPNSTI
jgi:hypothetical protein